MNKKYNLKLDLQFRCNNSTMKFNQFDNNTSDFFIRITNGGKLFDIEKAIVVLATIKPSGKVASQFVEIENGLVYADLKPNMKDEIGTYTAQAMLILEDGRVVTDTISYEVEEDKIFSLLNDTVETTEEFTLLTDMLSRLSTIEISEEQRVINEAERILSEENRKIEEAKRVEAELVRQHEEADRTKYDAIRESNENIRKINEEARVSSENVRLENEANRIEQEANRVKAEQLRKDNYNFMTEDEERRRSEANAHKEAEALRVQAETNRVNEEAKRRISEQARVSAENTRVSNENTRKASEVTRQTNETHRVEAETQRQNRYNSFIAEAEANANNFENYTNNAKVKEEERKANELDRKSQEDRRISNEVERISNENTRKANEVVREKNEASRQNVFENKVNEVDKKIVELNTTKDNFISSVNTKVDNKISEIEVAKSDMTTTVSNKIDEVENRFNALTSKQQQDAEVVDARDGETSLKARLDRDIEKAKQVYVNVEGSHISTDSSSGYLKDVEILGNTIQDTSNLADIRSVGDKVEGQELYEIPVLSRGKNLFDKNKGMFGYRFTGTNDNVATDTLYNISDYIKVKPIKYYINDKGASVVALYDKDKKFIAIPSVNKAILNLENYPNIGYIRFTVSVDKINSVQLEEGTVATPYEPYQEDKITILSPVQLEKVGDVADRIIEKDGVWGVEKNVKTTVLDGSEVGWYGNAMGDYFTSTLPNFNPPNRKLNGMCDKLKIKSKWDSQEKGIFINHNIIISLPLTEVDSINALKEWLKTNLPIIKYEDNNPQFIPLPHDQQVKLRTFANKTNISFLTEIEGTIKAQVPKSLGATVNTHTEQISNLNKELDRVKKLEESTVSTVETESDFTTVEATSNGYFEDVKLEGKTLVNLAKNTRITRSNTVGDFHMGDFGTCFDFPIDANKEYTFIINVLKNTSGVNLTMNDTGAYANFVFPRINSLVNGLNVLKLKVKENVTITQNSYWGTIGLRNSTTIGDIDVEVTILEGDHTQNPPSYFEGLKSVGDETDEIVVSSVKGDGNLFDATLDTQTKNGVTFSYDGATGEVVLNGTCTENNTCVMFKYPTKFIEGNTYYLRIFGTTINSPLANIRVYDDKYVGNNLATTGRGASIHKSSSTRKMVNTSIRVDSGVTFNNFRFKVQLTVNEDRAEYISHQSDKKRLLFYNNETQTWEKPVLRQWDSIEKHSDGKYYYHQRSVEVVLNGSEDWVINAGWSGEELNTNSYYLTGDKQQVAGLMVKSIGTTNIISEVMPTQRIIGSNPTSNDFDLVSGEANTSAIYIRINKSKVSNGIKPYLQQNPMRVVYQLAQEKVYECTNIDLITYANETNYIVECGAIVPKTTLKVHNNISNVVSLLQKKVSLLESNITRYTITQNRLMLTSRYNADTVGFKVDVATLRNSFEYDNDLYELILNNILVGKDNYDREYIENLIIFYWMDFVISDEMHSALFEIIEEQHNPKVIEDEEAPL